MMLRHLAAASLGFLALFTVACDFPEERATIKVVNYWDRVVIFSLDGREVARLQPLTKEEEEVDEGSYKVTLALESGAILFELQFFIEKEQEVVYQIQPDGTVLASGGAKDE